MENGKDMELDTNTAHRFFYAYAPKCQQGMLNSYAILFMYSTRTPNMSVFSFEMHKINSALEIDHPKKNMKHL